MSSSATERYKERYATWRHLDGLRYRTLQILVSALAGTLTILELFDKNLPPMAWFAISFFLFFQWQVLSKINDGIVANGHALHQFGTEVGDNFIPSTQERKNSVFHYLEWAIFLFAVGTTLYGVWLLIK